MAWGWLTSLDVGSGFLLIIIAVICGLCILSRFACGIASTIDAYQSANRIKYEARGVSAMAEIEAFPIDPQHKTNDGEAQ